MSKKALGIIVSPIIISSTVLLTAQLNAAPSTEFVGTGSSFGIGYSEGGTATLDFDTTISSDAHSATNVGLWAGYDMSEGRADTVKEFSSAGAHINHAWVNANKRGQVDSVSKVFAAYDMRKHEEGEDDGKITLGYGQETESMFWDVHAMGRVQGESRIVQAATADSPAVYQKAYEYGVGGNVGAYNDDGTMRYRAGLDHFFADNEYDNEDRASTTVLSAGIDKHFKNTPHSISLNGAVAKRHGGVMLAGEDDVSTQSNVAYRYHFGDDAYQSNVRFKRIRVEQPGVRIPARYESKPVYGFKKQYKRVAVKKPYKRLVKNTMMLEGQTFFKLNSYNLIPSAKDRLIEIARKIRAHGYKGRIRVTGNTCGLGDPAYDQKLSEQRANAVKQFLISQGFDANRIISRGLGKNHPKYPRTPNADFKNRRVDIEYISDRSVSKVAYKTEYKSVVSGSKKVVTGYKKVMISPAKVGAPKVIWKTQAIKTAPLWIKRALNNRIERPTTFYDYKTTKLKVKEDQTTVPPTTPTTPTTPVDPDSKDDKDKKSASVSGCHVEDMWNQNSGC